MHKRVTEKRYAIYRPSYVPLPGIGVSNSPICADVYIEWILCHANAVLYPEENQIQDIIASFSNKVSIIM